MGAGAADDRFADPLHFRTGDRNLQTLPPCQEGEAECERFLRGEAFLGLSGGFLEPCIRLRGGGVDPGLSCQESRDRLVEIITSEAGVTMGGENLKDTIVELQDREVEGASSEIVDGDLGAVGELVESVGEGRGRWFRQDALNGKAGKLTRLLRGRTLGIVEVGRNRDNRTVDLCAEAILGDCLQALQNFRRDFLGSQLLPIDGKVDRGALRTNQTFRSFVTEAATNEPLHRGDRAVGVQALHAAGLPADQNAPVLPVVNDRRGQAVSIGIGQKRRKAALIDPDEGVGGA